MKEPHTFNKFDKLLYSSLNYITFFGWLIPIWSPVYKMEIFLTWLGCLLMGLMMASMKSDNEKARRKMKRRGKTE